MDGGCKQPERLEPKWPRGMYMIMYIGLSRTVACHSYVPPATDPKTSQTKIISERAGVARPLHIPLPIPAQSSLRVGLPTQLPINHVPKSQTNGKLQPQGECNLQTLYVCARHIYSFHMFCLTQGWPQTCILLSCSTCPRENRPTIPPLRRWRLPRGLCLKCGLPSTHS